MQFKQPVLGPPQIRALKRQTLAMVAIDAIHTDAIYIDAIYFDAVHTDAIHIGAIHTVATSISAVTLWIWRRHNGDAIARAA